MSEQPLIDKETACYAIALSSGIFSGLKSAWADSVIKTIDVGRGANSIAFNPANNDIYVTNQGSNTVSIIDSSSNAVVGTVSVGASPRGIAFNPSNNDMYVVNFVSRTVSVIDSSANKVVDTIYPCYLFSWIFTSSSESGGQGGHVGGPCGTCG